MTERQRQILERLRLGFSKKETAYQLGICTKTLDYHLHSLYRTHRVSNLFALINQLYVLTPR